MLIVRKFTSFAVLRKLIKLKQVLIDWLFYVFSFMFKPSQRVMYWLDERLEALKAYKGFHKRYIMKAASLLERKGVFLVFVFTRHQ